MSSVGSPIFTSQIRNGQFLTTPKKLNFQTRRGLNIKIKSPDQSKAKYQSVKISQLQEGDVENAAIINTNRSEIFTESLQSSPQGRGLLVPKHD